MRIENVSLVGLGLVALLSMSAVAVAEDKPAASASEWYSVALSDNEEAFVKTSSIKLVGTMLQARVKENYLSPRESTKKGKTYQSVRTDYRIDCTPRKVAMVESKFYCRHRPAGRGDPEGFAQRQEPHLDGCAACHGVRRDPGLQLQARADSRAGRLIDARAAGVGPGWMPVTTTGEASSHERRTLYEGA